MKRVALLGALLCVLVAPLCLAQDGEEDPVTAGKAFLSSLIDYDDAMAGTYYYGIYMQGKKNIGTLTIIVSGAPEGSGAVYKFEFEAKIEFAGKKILATGTTYCDASFAMVSHKDNESEDGEIKTQAVSVEDGKWLCEATYKAKENEEEEEGREGAAVYRYKTAEKNHIELVSGWALSRKLDRVGKFTFHGIKFPELNGAMNEEKDLDDDALKTLAVSVSEPAPFEFRGKKVTARKIEADIEDDDDFIMMVGQDGKIVAFWPKDAPIQFIAGTPEEVTKDIEVAENPAETQVKSVVRTFIKVLAKVEDIDVLDEIVDWESVRQEKVEFADSTAEETAKAVKDMFRALPAAVPEAQIDLIMNLINLKWEEEDKARLILPGGGGADFIVKKFGEKWKIIQFPS